MPPLNERYNDNAECSSLYHVEECSKYVVWTTGKLCEAIATQIAAIVCEIGPVPLTDQIMYLQAGWSQFSKEPPGSQNGYFYSKVVIYDSKTLTSVQLHFNLIRTVIGSCKQGGKDHTSCADDVETSGWLVGRLTFITFIAATPLKIR